jgi:hypothetical protein
MDSRTALETCENALRQLMQFAYLGTFGPDWLNAISNSTQRRTWSKRAAAEAGVRPGAAVVPPLGLAYSDFSDLVMIAGKHWDPIEPALGPKDETLPLLARFDQLRNSVAHSRGILTFEEDMLSGIAGQIRNQVTIYMSTQDPSGDYYPRIELVTDGFGNCVAPVPGPATGFVIADGLCRAPEVIRIGQSVDFDCTGTDPKDRQLEWKLRTAGVPEQKVKARSGERVRLRWTPEITGEQTEVQIHLNSPSKYHRHFGHDSLVLFVYRVLPPENE